MSVLSSYGLGITVSEILLKYFTCVNTHMSTCTLWQKEMISKVQGHLYPKINGQVFIFSLMIVFKMFTSETTLTNIALKALDKGAFQCPKGCLSQ